MTGRRLGTALTVALMVSAFGLFTTIAVGGCGGSSGSTTPTPTASPTPCANPTPQTLPGNNWRATATPNVFCGTNGWGVVLNQAGGALTGTTTDTVCAGSSVSIDSAGTIDGCGNVKVRITIREANNARVVYEVTGTLSGDTITGTYVTVDTVTAPVLPPIAANVGLTGAMVLMKN
jgi:hypothetical protein